MNQMGVKTAWGFSKGVPEVVVAVIDTGVDYTHEDLVDNMWRNPKEIVGNGVDDDRNGYVDDIVGWDFVSNDNKPYDLTATLMDMLMNGGNPGHGTHCAGNVAARGDNGKGIAGVAPNVRIMALRFISEKGQGTTADAVKAIKYAVDNGARVTSNSWGSTGEDPKDPDTGALKDAIAYSESKGVLFVAAAGNGDKMGKGYDNDTSAEPAYPASYPNDIIVSVAAIDEAGNLGTFTNWGARSVDIGASGVKVFSTVTQSVKYTDTVVDIPGVLTATWDGTSMAAPHVAGAAALYLSYYPNKTWRDVKAALMNSVKKTNVLSGKTTSGGQLDVQNLMRF
jgi:subtilisin family serine protease